MRLGDPPRPRSWSRLALLRLAERLASVALVSLAPAGCSCDGGATLTGGTSSILVDRPAINLGRVFLGSSARATFTLSAPGVIPVNYSTRLDGDAFGYQIGPAVGLLPPNGAVEMVVLFRPGALGTANAQALFSSDATRNATASVALFATGVAPPDCEDGNGCTVDTFNLEVGRCEHSAERLSCDDFNACTQADVCVGAVCLGESKSCDDGDICTDDLCDPLAGCIQMPATSCVDRNPCTLDTCDPVLGCQRQDAPDGTPCDDLEPCTLADICVFGRCIGITVPEGIPCDDGDPCSKNDQCLQGTCQAPGYTPPAVGELKFATEVGTLAEGASENPLLDRDSNLFVGVEGGVIALDHCGEPLWSNLEIGSPRFRAAVALPGVLSVPVGSRLVDLETSSGRVTRSLDLSDLFAAPETSSTATTSVRILDLALRASGALIASVVRETAYGSSIERQGMLAEIDRTHTTATKFQSLGALHASRIAIDADEAIIAVLRDGRPDKGVATERLARFGVNGLPETSWSTSDVSAVHTEIAITGPGQVLWTPELRRVGRSGDLASLLPSNLDRAAEEDAGSPIVAGDDAIVARPYGDRPAGADIDARPFELIAVNADTARVTWSTLLDAPAPRMSPAVDLSGNTYVATADGVIHAFTAGGRPIFTTVLPIGADAVDSIALGISPEGVVVAVARGRAFGVKSVAALANSSWPRHRRDNLGTGHR